jgi:hypothetical protein
MSELICSTESAQKPCALGSAARFFSLPSLPTTCDRRESSSAIIALCSTEVVEHLGHLAEGAAP